MEILRMDLENKEELEQLVEIKLSHMGVYEDANIKDNPKFWLAIKEYFVGMLEDHLNNSEDIVITGYFDDSELALWGFIAGWKATLLAS